MVSRVGGKLLENSALKCWVGGRLLENGALEFMRGTIFKKRGIGSAKCCHEVS